MVEGEIDFVGFELGNDIPNHLHENRKIGIHWGCIWSQIRVNIGSVISGAPTLRKTRIMFSMRCNSILLRGGFCQYAVINGCIQSVHFKVGTPSFADIAIWIDDNTSNRPFKSLFIYDHQTITKRTKNCCTWSLSFLSSYLLDSVIYKRKTVYSQQ